MDDKSNLLFPAKDVAELMASAYVEGFRLALDCLSDVPMDKKSMAEKFYNSFLKKANGQ